MSLETKEYGKGDKNLDMGLVFLGVRVFFVVKVDSAGEILILHEKRRSGRTRRSRQYQGPLSCERLRLRRQLQWDSRHL
jgi:hypothetical protein